MTEEQTSSKLKSFVLLVFIIILAMSPVFCTIQDKLTTPEPPTDIPKKAEENTPKIAPIQEQNKPDNDPPKNKEPEKSTKLTWPEFGQKLKAFEDKRQEVLMQLEQKLPNNPPDKTMSSSKNHDIQELASETIEEEKTSWGKVIQHWQQLNDQQQRLSKPES